MEDFEILFNMTKAELDALPYDVYKWNCCCKDCKNATTVRDYGLETEGMYFLNRNGKAADKNPKSYWMNLFEIYWFCGKHWKYFQRLGQEAMFKKFVDYEKDKLAEKIKEVNTGIRKIG
jgi:hypothetical protein